MMPDLQSESRALRQAFAKVAADVINDKTRSCFRLYKAIVDSPPDGLVCKVKLIGDKTVLSLPYSTQTAGVNKDDMVWVATLSNSFSSALVWETYNFKSPDSQVLGRFTNYSMSDLRAASDGWRVYIKRSTPQRLCIRFENQYFISTPASRVFYTNILSDARYIIQVNNDANQGFWDIRAAGASSATPKGASQVWFDYTNGFLELMLDMSIAGLDQVSGITIDSAQILNYSGNKLADFTGVYFIYP